jgi:hypothetical protein
MGGGTTRRSARKGEEEDKDARGAVGRWGDYFAAAGGFFFQNDREIGISSSNTRSFAKENRTHVLLHVLLPRDLYRVETN